MNDTKFNVLLALLLMSIANALEALTDTNFKTAVDLWVSDVSTATNKYGHIKDW
jgi:hypothetical protein